MMNKGFLTLAMATLVCGIGVAETKRVHVDGLKSGTNAIGVRVEGCKAVRVQVDGNDLVEEKGAFVPEFIDDVITADASIEVEVPTTCKTVKLSEMKSEQLSQEEDDLPAPVEKEQAPPAPPADGPAPTTVNEGNQQAGTPAPAGGLRSQQTRARGAMIQVPGRVNQNSHNRTFDSSVDSSGKTRHTYRIENNIGQNVDINRPANNTISRTSRSQASDNRVRTSQTGKGGKSTSDTPADAGHSQFDSHNSLASSGVLDFGNFETETTIVGNVGGSVRISDGVTNRVEETSEFLAPPQPKPAPQVTNNTYVQETKVVRQSGYFFRDVYGNLWWQPY